MYGLHTDSKSSKQFWDLIHEVGGKDGLDARKHSIKEIVEGKLFKKVSESWTKKTISEGKRERCAVVCGQDLDILKNQANKIFRYESYKQ